MKLRKKHFKIEYFCNSLFYIKNSYMDSQMKINFLEDLKKNGKITKKMFDNFGEFYQLKSVLNNGDFKNNDNLLG